MDGIRHPFNFSDIEKLDKKSYKELKQCSRIALAWKIERVCQCNIPASYTGQEMIRTSVLNKLRKAFNANRPLESGDVVRIKSGDYANTGVVNRIDSLTDMVNVFTTKNNPSGLGTWFNKKDLKRIGRVHNRR